MTGKPFRSILPLEIGISLADHTILFGIIEVYLLKIGKKNKYQKRRKNPRKVFSILGEMNDRIQTVVTKTLKERVY